MLALCFAMASSTSESANLAETLQKPVTATVMSKRTLFDAEQCLLSLSWKFIAVAYRRPDRPDESLIYWAGPFPESRALRLSKSPTGTKIELIGIDAEKADLCL